MWLSPAHTQQREEWLSLIAELNTRIERLEKELEPWPTLMNVSDESGHIPVSACSQGWRWSIRSRQSAAFPNSRKVTAYVGLEPMEYSSGEKQRFSGISKAGSRLLRFLLVEAGNSAASNDEHLKQIYHRILHRRDRARAKVAVARHVLIHAYIMLRDEIDYAEFLRRGVTVRSARTVHRPQVPARLIERPASEPPPQG